MNLLKLLLGLMLVMPVAVWMAGMGVIGCVVAATVGGFGGGWRLFELLLDKVNAKLEATVKALEKLQ